MENTDTAWPGLVGWLRLDIPEELRDRHPTKGIISTNTEGGYIAECGTSMAAPASCFDVTAICRKTRN
ncbi:MAG: hypothetical protein V3U87_08195 [Methylococcaceae bacterium]